MARLSGKKGVGEGGGGLPPYPPPTSHMAKEGTPELSLLARYSDFIINLNF